MGNYFSDLHVKKSAFSIEELKIQITSYFTEQGYVPTTSDASDFELTIDSPVDSEWISVYGDSMEYTDVLQLAPRISQNCMTDVLSAACFDSDYLFLHLLNIAQKRDLWLNIGKSDEIQPPRRSNLSAWKNAVTDYDAFKTAAKQSYVFAEDFLEAVSQSLHITSAQVIGCNRAASAERMYFSAVKKSDFRPTKLKIHHYNLMPCEPERMTSCRVNNLGDASRGIEIMFLGDYIEHDEITIEDVMFCYKTARDEEVSIPITMEKRQRSDGSWVYYWADKDFLIQRAVSSNLPKRIYNTKESQRTFGIRYTPRGNKRKFLDICVAFIPMSNRQDGHCVWCVWAYHASSKREYIEKHNRTTQQMHEMWGAPLNLISFDDYDLD